jgi:hypothetical protein
MRRDVWFDAGVILLLLMTPGHAGPCRHSIDRVQSQVDAAIDKRAGSGPWLPESSGAVLSHQPTPQSIAAAEATSGRGQRLQGALNSLDRARAADSAGNVKLCRAELKKAKRALRQPRSAKPG